MDIDSAGRQEALNLKSRPFFGWIIRLKHLVLVKEKMNGLSRCESEERKVPVEEYCYEIYEVPSYASQRSITTVSGL